MKSKNILNKLIINNIKKYIKTELAYRQVNMEILIIMNRICLKNNSRIKTNYLLIKIIKKIIIKQDKNYNNKFSIIVMVHF